MQKIIFVKFRNSEGILETKLLKFAKGKFLDIDADKDSKEYWELYQGGQKIEKSSDVPKSIDVTSSSELTSPGGKTYIVTDAFSFTRYNISYFVDGIAKKKFGGKGSSGEVKRYSVKTSGSEGPEKPMLMMVKNIRKGDFVELEGLDKKSREEAEKLNHTMIWERRSLVAEVGTSAIYRFFLDKLAPVISPVFGHEYYYHYSSKFLSQFNTLSYYIKNKQLKQILEAKGLEHVLAVCLLTGDLDYNPGNGGIKDNQIAKIDGGKALVCKFSDPRLMLEKFLSHFFLFYGRSECIGIDIKKLITAISEVINKYESNLPQISKLAEQGAVKVCATSLDLKQFSFEFKVNGTKETTELKRKDDQNDIEFIQSAIVDVLGSNLEAMKGLVSLLKERSGQISKKDQKGAWVGKWIDEINQKFSDQVIQAGNGKNWRDVLTAIIPRPIVGVFQRCSTALFHKQPTIPVVSTSMKVIENKDIEIDQSRQKK